MNDTVKLIIEIPKEDYEFTKGAKMARVFPSEYYVKLILNGIPLDTVKAEIREQQKEYQEWGWAYDDVLEILDNIGKESEDTVRNARKVTKKDSHKEWWDSFYKGEVKPNE